MGNLLDALLRSLSIFDGKLVADAMADVANRSTGHQAEHQASQLGTAGKLPTAPVKLRRFDTQVVLHRRFLFANHLPYDLSKCCCDA